MSPKERIKSLKAKRRAQANKLKRERALNNKLINNNPYVEAQDEPREYLYVFWPSESQIVVGLGEGGKWKVKRRST